MSASAARYLSNKNVMARPHASSVLSLEQSFSPPPPESPIESQCPESVSSSPVPRDSRHESRGQFCSSDGDYGAHGDTTVVRPIPCRSPPPSVVSFYYYGLRTDIALPANTTSRQCRQYVVKEMTSQLMSQYGEHLHLGPEFEDSLVFQSRKSNMKGDCRPEGEIHLLNYPESEAILHPATLPSTIHVYRRCPGKPLRMESDIHFRLSQKATGLCEAHRRRKPEQRSPMQTRKSYPSEYHTEFREPASSQLCSSSTEVVEVPCPTPVPVPEWKPDETKLCSFTEENHKKIESIPEQFARYLSYLHASVRYLNCSSEFPLLLPCSSNAKLLRGIKLEIRKGHKTVVSGPVKPLSFLSVSLSSFGLDLSSACAELYFLNLRNEFLELGHPETTEFDISTPLDAKFIVIYVTTSKGWYLHPIYVVSSPSAMVPHHDIMPMRDTASITAETVDGSLIYIHARGMGVSHTYARITLLHLPRDTPLLRLKKVSIPAVFTWNPLKFSCYSEYKSFCLQLDCEESGHQEKHVVIFQEIDTVEAARCWVYQLAWLENNEEKWLPIIDEISKIEDKQFHTMSSSERYGLLSQINISFGALVPDHHLRCLISKPCPGHLTWNEQYQ